MIEIYNIYTKKELFKYILLKNLPRFLYKYVLRWKYKTHYNSDLDLKNPVKFSEKLQYIKLYGITNKKKYLSDKLYSKHYVKSLIPEIEIAEVYQTGTSFENLNFDKLPNKFILKTNHSWSTNIIIEDKNKLTKKDIKILKKYYDNAIKINFAYWSYYELQYRNIKPQIYAEQLLGNYCSIKDYEVFCFNGIPEFILYRYSIEIDGYPVNRQVFMNTDWQKLDCHINRNKGEINYISEHKNMIFEYSKILSKNIDFVRVDFMEVNKKLYFCEMTFTPYSGFYSIYPKEKDIYYGKKLILKKKF